MKHETTDVQMVKDTTMSVDAVEVPSSNAIYYKLKRWSGVRICFMGILLGGICGRAFNFDGATPPGHLSPRTTLQATRAQCEA